MSEQHDYDGIKYRDEKSSPGIFRILFIVLVIWGIAFMGHYLFSGWSSQSEADSARRALADKKQAAHKAVEATRAGLPASGDKIEAYITAGKQLYGNLCVACHGENGKGLVGPDLTASTFKYGKTRADIAKTISGGRPGGMPAFNSQIDNEKIESLVEFILSLK